MRKLFSLILVCVIIMTLSSGCGSADNTSGIDELTPASSVSLGESQAGELKEKTPYKLYFINEQGKLAPETRYIDNTEVTKGTENVATVLVKELISGPAKGSLLQSTIPEGTKVNSTVTIKDGIATVDLTKDFIEKHKGGKKSEQLTLYSVVNTLTEIKDIKSVQFKIEGKVRKEFKGSYQLDVAFPRSAYLNTTQPEEQDVIKLDENASKNNTNKNNQDKDNINKDNINKDKTNKDNINKDNSTPNNSKTNDNQLKSEPEKDQKTNSDVETETELLE